MDAENYIEHEVQLRMHTKQFEMNEKRFERMDAKLNALIMMVASGFLLPAIIHYLGWF